MLMSASGPSAAQPAFRRSMGLVSHKPSKAPLRVETVIAIRALSIWDSRTEEGWADVCGAPATQAEKGLPRHSKGNHPAASAMPKNASVPQPPSVLKTVRTFQGTSLKFCVPGHTHVKYAF